MSSGSKGGRAGGKVGGQITSNTPSKPITNCIRSRGRENDWTIEHAVSAGFVKQEFPESCDLREGNEWYTIGDQALTGSCVSWAATDSLLRWHLVKANRIKPNERLSIRFTWMAAKETDKFTSFAETFIEKAGTPLKGALDVLRKFGCVPEEVLPFEGGMVDYDWDTETFYAKASQYSIKSYFSVIEEFNVNIDHIKMWIASVGPIIVLSSLDSNFHNYDNGGKLEVYDKASVDPESGHAFAIVGYTPTHFIVRNSWGETWGDKGYALASNQYIKDAICEGYGILT